MSPTASPPTTYPRTKFRGSRRDRILKVDADRQLLQLEAGDGKVGVNRGLRSDLRASATFSAAFSPTHYPRIQFRVESKHGKRGTCILKKVQKDYLCVESNQRPMSSETEALPLHQPAVHGKCVKKLFMRSGNLREFLGARSTDVSGMGSYF